MKTYKIKYKLYQVNDNEGPEICKPDTAWKALKDDFQPFAEELYLLILNTKNRIIGKHLIIEKYLVSRGSHNTMVMIPADILKMVMINNGCNFIIAHNHPSGDISPSEEDIIFTKKINEAAKICGLNLLDHIIFTDVGYTSLNKEGLLS